MEEGGHKINACVCVGGGGVRYTKADGGRGQGTWGGHIKADNNVEQHHIHNVIYTQRQTITWSNTIYTQR